jgi:hypothetical protein
MHSHVPLQFDLVHTMSQSIVLTTILLPIFALVSVVVVVRTETGAP